MDVVIYLDSDQIQCVLLLGYGLKNKLLWPAPVPFPLYLHKLNADEMAGTGAARLECRVVAMFEEWLKNEPEVTEIPDTMELPF